MKLAILNDSENSNISKNEDTTAGACKSKLYILVGIPCAGKSTYAEYFLKNQDTKIVSTDEIRKELTGTYACNNKENNSIFYTAKQRICELLSSGFDVIFDATNICREHRKDFIDIAKDTNSLAIAIVFQTTLRLCLERNSKRPPERRVPKGVIENMFLRQTNPETDEGFDDIILVEA